MAARLERRVISRGSMRDKSIPPPRFFRSRDASTAPAARRVHEICDSAVWRFATPARRLRYAVLVLLWPLLVAGMAMPWLRRNAAATRTLTGKSATRQFCEIVRLAVAHRVTPKYYYIFEFYLDERRAHDSLRRGYPAQRIEYVSGTECGLGQFQFQ